MLQPAQLFHGDCLSYPFQWQCLTVSDLKLQHLAASGLQG